MKKNLWMIMIVGAFSCIAGNSLAATTCVAELLVAGDPVRSFIVTDVSYSDASSKALSECQDARISRAAAYPRSDHSKYTCDLNCHSEN